MNKGLIGLSVLVPSFKMVNAGFVRIECDIFSASDKVTVFELKVQDNKPKMIKDMIYNKLEVIFMFVMGLNAIYIQQIRRVEVGLFFNG